MTRLHIHVGVSDLPRSIDFYTSLFGVEPSFRADDYARWQLDDPAVNFAIKTGHARTGVDHVGLQAATPAEFRSLRAGFRAAGLEGVEQERTACCHARSDKTWLTDPDGVSWEAFYTHEQLAEPAACCGAGSEVACCA